MNCGLSWIWEVWKNSNLIDFLGIVPECDRPRRAAIQSIVGIMLHAKKPGLWENLSWVAKYFVRNRVDGTCLFSIICLWAARAQLPTC